MPFHRPLPFTVKMETLYTVSSACSSDFFPAPLAPNALGVKRRLAATETHIDTPPPTARCPLQLLVELSAQRGGSAQTHGVVARMARLGQRVHHGCRRSQGRLPPPPALSKAASRPLTRSGDLLS